MVNRNLLVTIVIYHGAKERVTQPAPTVDTPIDQKKLALFLKRSEAFEAFTAQRLTKRSLADALSVSRPTAYRIITAFEEDGLVRPVDGEYELTRLGAVIREAITTFQTEVTAAVALEPLLTELPEELDFDHRLFADAVVTEATYDDLPVALAVFEERIGIGIHTEEMGTPVTWVDTGNPDAIVWGERLCERYRSEATPLH